MSVTAMILSAFVVLVFIEAVVTAYLFGRRRAYRDAIEVFDKFIKEELEEYKKLEKGGKE